MANNLESDLFQTHQTFTIIQQELANANAFVDHWRKQSSANQKQLEKILVLSEAIAKALTFTQEQLQLSQSIHYVEKRSRWPPMVY